MVPTDLGPRGVCSVVVISGINVVSVSIRDPNITVAYAR